MGDVPHISLCEPKCFSMMGTFQVDCWMFRPGWVHTGLTGAKAGNPKPAGAWTPEQTVDYMVEKVFEEGDFYVICPDNETSSVCYDLLVLSSKHIRLKVLWF